MCSTTPGMEHGMFLKGIVNRVKSDSKHLLYRILRNAILFMLFVAFTLEYS